MYQVLTINIYIKNQFFVIFDFVIPDPVILKIIIYKFETIINYYWDG